jgi:hypothetical protein
VFFWYLMPLKHAVIPICLLPRIYFQPTFVSDPTIPGLFYAPPPRFVKQRTEPSSGPVLFCCSLQHYANINKTYLHEAVTLRENNADPCFQNLIHHRGADYYDGAQLGNSACAKGRQ